MPSHRWRTRAHGLNSHEYMHPVRRRVLLRNGRQHTRRLLVHDTSRGRPATRGSGWLLVPRLPHSAHRPTRARHSSHRACRKSRTQELGSESNCLPIDQQKPDHSGCCGREIVGSIAQKIDSDPHWWVRACGHQIAGSGRSLWVRKKRIISRLASGPLPSV